MVAGGPTSPACHQKQLNQYDLAGRRTQLQVGGQTEVTYGYDNADRLLTITQGTTVVGFGYDDADRRTSLTLPGTLSVIYGYDDASQLLSLTYKRSTTTIGDLAYTYDQSGRRATTSGTYARLNLPAALTSAQYDANNRVFNWAGTTISYDLNGNMAGDGVNTYAWNARDQLSAVTKTGQTLPSFTYDAFGRRQKKTLGATVTSYLYDGANTVQELTTGSPPANMLTGLGVDEVFQRTEGATTRTFLSDPLGSTLALADSAGAVQTSYTYAPYGAMTFTGTASNNTSQFTGRENDSDGLYFYRARYYHPVMSRFVSEDPIGFGGGDPNLYAYAHDSPTNFTDPSGKSAVAVGLTSSAFVLSGRKSHALAGFALNVINTALFGFGSSSRMVDGVEVIDNASTLSLLGLPTRVLGVVGCWCLEASNTLTYSQDLIVSNTTPSARVLNHEMGHVEQARETGWLYLPLYVGAAFDVPGVWLGAHLTGHNLSLHDAHPMERNADMRQGLGDPWRR